MVQTTNTVEGWGGVIADLAGKRLAASERVQALRSEKKALALEAAMGGAEAQKKLAKANSALTTAAFELDDLEQAILQAEGERKQAEQGAAEIAEKARQEQIVANLKQYLGAVQEIDAGLHLLAQRFAVAKQNLDRAEALMNADERRPIQQLRSRFGPTLAAAYYGLAGYIELGPEVSHVAHHQPLERFAMGFIDRWVTPPVDPDPPDGSGN